jgi:hypothetical protein
VYVTIQPITSKIFACTNTPETPKINMPMISALNMTSMLLHMILAKDDSGIM